MKKILVIAAFLLLSTAIFAQTGRSIYNKYSEEKDVSAVYISPAMFRLIGKLPDMNLGGEEDVNLTSLIKSLDGFYLIDSDNQDVNAGLEADFKRFVNGGKYELLMEVKEEGETVTLYIISNDKTVTSFVMLAKEGDECTFICMDGQMSKEDLEKLIAL